MEFCSCYYDAIINNKNPCIEIICGILINDVCLFWQDHVAKYIHVDTNQDHGDEGKVQLYKVETETLTKFDVLYITVWAVNKVSTKSYMSRICL